MKTCYICGKPLPSRKTKYCSPDCLKKGHLIKSTIWNQENRDKVDQRNRKPWVETNKRLIALTDRVNALEKTVRNICQDSRFGPLIYDDIPPPSKNPGI